MATYWGDNYGNYQYGTNYSDTMYGYGGNDVQYGYGGNDSIYGMDGNDSSYGMDGNDYVSGGAGNDYVNGGAGVDTVVGGTGADSLVGGYDYSADYFRFSQGDSPSWNGYADTIQDWNVSYDYIDMPIAGSYYNYAEAWTSATSIASARAHVEGNSALRAEDHVFLYNSGTDTGYLLSDLDRNNSFETGVIIRGAGSSWDMSYSDIV